MGRYSSVPLVSLKGPWVPWGDRPSEGVELHRNDNDDVGVCLALNQNLGTSRRKLESQIKVSRQHQVP